MGKTKSKSKDDIFITIKTDKGREIEIDNQSLIDAYYAKEDEKSEEPVGIKPSESLQSFTWVGFTS